VEVSNGNVMLCPVLSDEELRACEFVELLTVTTENPKDVNAIIKHLNLSIPLLYHHLKRVKKITQNEKEVFAIIVGNPGEHQEEIQNLQKQFGLNLLSVKIPLHAPLNINQYNEGNSHWPLLNRTYDPTTPDPKFSVIQISLIEQFMQMAYEQAKIAKTEGNRSVGCVVVNSQWKVVTVDYDRSKSHILKHAALNCIDSVSLLQLQQNDSDPDNSHLCNGFMCFLTDEPCIMCSMALLHSRISMVVFHRLSPENGGLISRFKIH
jgi:tRNA-specific adenosine deaminase 3